MAALATNFCTTQPAFDHDKLAPEAQCPFCHCKGLLRSRPLGQLRPPTPSLTFEPCSGLDEVPLQPPLQGKGKGKLGKGTHKRTISAAIPNTESEAT